MFQRVYGVHTTSGNNGWMKGKLLQGEAGGAPCVWAAVASGQHAAAAAGAANLEFATHPHPHPPPPAALGFNARWRPSSEQQGDGAAGCGSGPTGSGSDGGGSDATRLCSRERRPPRALKQAQVQEEEQPAISSQKKRTTAGLCRSASLKRVRSDVDTSPFAAAANAAAAAAAGLPPTPPPRVAVHVLMPSSHFGQHMPAQEEFDLSRAASWHTTSRGQISSTTRQQSVPVPHALSAAPYLLMSHSSAGSCMEAAALSALKALGWGPNGSNAQGQQVWQVLPGAPTGGPDHAAAVWQAGAVLQQSIERHNAASRQLAYAAAQCGAGAAAWPHIMTVGAPPAMLERHASAPCQLLQPGHYWAGRGTPPPEPPMQPYQQAAMRVPFAPATAAAQPSSFAAASADSLEHELQNMEALSLAYGNSGAVVPAVAPALSPFALQSLQSLPQGDASAAPAAAQEVAQEARPRQSSLCLLDMSGINWSAMMDDYLQEVGATPA